MIFTPRNKGNSHIKLCIHRKQKLDADEKLSYFTLQLLDSLGLPTQIKYNQSQLNITLCSSITSDYFGNKSIIKVSTKL